MKLIFALLVAVAIRAEANGPDKIVRCTTPGLSNGGVTFEVTEILLKTGGVKYSAAIEQGYRSGTHASGIIFDIVISEAQGNGVLFENAKKSFSLTITPKSNTSNLPTVKLVGRFIDRKTRVRVPVDVDADCKWR